MQETSAFGVLKMHENIFSQTWIPHVRTTRYEQYKWKYHENDETFNGFTPCVFLETLKSIVNESSLWKKPFLQASKLWGTINMGTEVS